MNIAAGASLSSIIKATATPIVYHVNISQSLVTKAFPREASRPL